MIHAYDEIFLDHARDNLAVMFDYALNGLGYDLSYFWVIFLVSETSHKFELGDISTIAGRSGVELCNDILEIKEKGKEYLRTKRNKEYWLGFSLAYYQWYKNVSFYSIAQKVDINDIQKLYMPYHEMDIKQFLDKMDELFNDSKKSNLKTIRLKAGYTQKELANLTNISLRTIQQYEQKQKNIAAAKAETICLLAKSLCVEENDILEL